MRGNSNPLGEGADWRLASSFPWPWGRVLLYIPREFGHTPSFPLPQPGGPLLHLLRRQRWASIGAPGKLLGKRGRAPRGGHLALYNERFPHSLGFFFLTYFIPLLGPSALVLNSCLQSTLGLWPLVFSLWYSTSGLVDD